MHLEIAIELGKIFTINFPQSSFGIAGSVARGSHSYNSDLDLLLLDNSFKKNRQYVFMYKDIEVNILCLNIELIKMKLTDNILFFDSQHIGYIRNCRIIYDQNHQISDLKKFVMNLVEDKLSYPESILNRIEVYLDSYLNYSYLIKNKQKDIAIRFLFSYWFAQKGKILLEKSDIKNIFDDLLINDLPIYNSLLFLIDGNSVVLKLFEQIYKTLKKDRSKDKILKTKENYNPK